MIEARRNLVVHCMIGVSLLDRSARQSGSMIGEGRSALETAVRRGDAHRASQPDSPDPAKVQKPSDPSSLILYFLWIFPIWHFSLVCSDEKNVR